MRATTLLPDADVLHLDALVADERGVTMVVTTTGDTASCPACGHPSARRHSQRCRTIADLPWQGLAVRVELHFRRFYCDVSTCARCTFTEPLPSVVAPYARRTRRLTSLVEAVAVALGGEAGARLLARLGCALSADTLLDAIRAAHEPAVPAPRVLGIDDWSWRRGHRFGTILVDLERHAVVDLLPDRAVDSVVAWLQRHPEITVIARDRSGVYAEAARQGAPQATQAPTAGLCCTTWPRCWRSSSCTSARRCGKRRRGRRRAARTATRPRRRGAAPPAP